MYSLHWRLKFKINIQVHMYFFVLTISMINNLNLQLLDIHAK